MTIDLQYSCEREPMTSAPYIRLKHFWGEGGDHSSCQYCIAVSTYLSNGMQPQGSWLVLLSTLFGPPVFLEPISRFLCYMLCPQMMAMVGR